MTKGGTTKEKDGATKEMGGGGAVEDGREEGREAEGKEGARTIAKDNGNGW